jgi:hypothetical protein
MSLSSDLWDAISELWFAPMFWPVITAFVIAEHVDSWAVLVLVMPLLLAIIVFGIPLLLPVQLLVFAGVFICALVMAPVHLIFGAPND